MPIYNVTSQWGGGGGGGANLYKGGEPYSIKTWGGAWGQYARMALQFGWLGARYSDS